MRTTLLVVGAALALQTPALAQGTRIADEGSFTILVNGRTAGRENFRITAVSRGDVTDYAARGEVTYGDRKVTPELTTGPDGAVIVYNVTTRSGASSETWKGAVVRGRLNAELVGGSSRSAREYIVPSGALVLDDEVIHQHWFLVKRTQSGSIPVVLPRQSNVQANAQMTTAGEETLQVGNHDVPATHLRATIAGEVHDIWVDKSGRLLKVALPGRALVAIRDDPPPA